MALFDRSCMTSWEVVHSESSPLKLQYFHNSASLQLAVKRQSSATTFTRTTFWKKLSW